MSSQFEIIGEEWRQRSRELADWAWERLVNRRDIWGQYASRVAGARARGGKTYSALTLPQKKRRGKDLVTLDKLIRHFGSLKRHHLIGLHSQSAEHTCKWCAIDIDLHDVDDRLREDAARRNFAAAAAWWEKLQARGYDPLLIDSNGRGGFHLLVLFARPAPLPDVHAFARDLVADWARRNLDFAPESFPKSATMEEGKFGAWLRLPGLHHTHDHFTRVWCGDAWIDDPWLSGNAAIDALLAATPGPPPPPQVSKFEIQTSNFSVPEIPGLAPDPKRKKNVCVDLDGVLARYEGWKGPAHFGEPIEGAVEFIRRLAARYRIIVCSSRVREGDGIEAPETLSLIAAWLDRHGFAYDEIHAGTGKPLAAAYVDDRGVSCRPQEEGQKAFEAAAAQVDRLARN